MKIEAAQRLLAANQPAKVTRQVCNKFLASHGINLEEYLPNSKRTSINASKGFRVTYSQIANADAANLSKVFTKKLGKPKVVGEVFRWELKDAAGHNIFLEINVASKGKDTPTSRDNSDFTYEDRTRRDYKITDDGESIREDRKGSGGFRS